MSGSDSTSRRNLRPLVTEAVAALIASAAGLVGGLAGLRFWHGSLRVPLSYDGDALTSFFFVQMGMSSFPPTGWALAGAPAALHQQDFPIGGDNASFLIVRLMSVVLDDPFVATNVLYLLGYSLAALTMYACARLLDVPRIVSGFAAFAFTTSPFHFWRGETHLMLSLYYGVPIGVYLALRIALGKPLVPSRGPRRRALRVALLAAACAIAASTGTYVATFTLILVCVCGVLVALSHRSVRAGLPALGTIALVMTFAVLNQVPTLVYHARHGSSDSVANRPASDVETYAGTLVEMLLPVPGHPINAFDDAADSYAQRSLRGDDELQSIGTIASIGLVLSLGFALLRAFGSRRGNGSDEPDSLRRRLLAAIAALQIALLLFVSVGGVSAIIGYLGFTSIRAWGRASIVVAVLALLFLAILVGRERAGKRGIAVCATLILGLPLLLVDQASRAFVPQYDHIAADFASDRAFGQELQTQLPAGADVFQVPYKHYPEHGAAPGQDSPYDNLRGVLHSPKLHWSYPAMRGRPEDFAGLLPTLGAAKTIKALERMGFEAIWIDRQSTVLAGAYVAELERLGRARTVVSPDNRFEVFRLESHEHPVTPVTANFDHGIRGFDYSPDDPLHGYRWITNDAQMTLRAPRGTDHRTVHVSGSLESGDAKTRLMELRVDGRERMVVEAKPGGTPFDFDVEVDEGGTTLTFRGDTSPPPQFPNETLPLSVRWLDPLVFDKELADR